jgi:hypothetical protein
LTSLAATIYILTQPISHRDPNVLTAAQRPDSGGNLIC